MYTWLRLFGVLVLVSALTGCGDDSTTKDDAKDGTTSALKYSDVQALITSSCAGSGCHAGASGSAGVDLSTEAGVRANAAASARRIEASTMPLASSAGYSAWTAATAQQRANVLNYLKAGAPE